MNKDEVRGAAGSKLLARGVNVISLHSQALERGIFSELARTYERAAFKIRERGYIGLSHLRLKCAAQVCGSSHIHKALGT